MTRFSMHLEARPWHSAAELHTLLVTYPLCVSAHNDTTDNSSEICPLKHTDFCLFLYHQSYTVLLGPLIPPMAFTSWHDRGSDQLSPDGRASTLTTQPLQLACVFEQVQTAGQLFLGERERDMGIQDCSDREAKKERAVQMQQ